MKPNHASPRPFALRAFLVTLASFAFLMSGGCASAPGKDGGTSRTAQKGKVSKEGEKITMEELDQLTYGFADRYMAYIVSACDEIEKSGATPQQRRLAHQVKLVQVSSIYDIVTNADPFTQLLDLTLVVTLQSQKWIDEDLAEEWFGDRAQPLINASQKARADIWKIASRVMKPEQLEVMDYLIWDWRRKNPSVQVVSFVRFDDFAASRGKSIVADVKSGTGLLAPVSDALKSVDEVRLFTERAFYYGKRMPFLMNWQAEAAVDNILGNSQIEGMTNSVATVTKSVDRITAMTERIPDEIEKTQARVVNDVQRLHPMLLAGLGQYRNAVSDTEDLVGSVNTATVTADTLLKTLKDTSVTLNSTMESVDKIFLAPGRGEPKPINQKPFEIESYTASALALATALKEANQLLSTTGELLGSQRLEQPMKQVNAIATERVEHARITGTRIIDVAFWRGAALIVLFFVMLTLYKLFTSRLSAKSGRSGNA
jgi:hypothetical protein